MIKPLPTRERLIDIAGDIFGREGFKAATVRKIAEEANANVAAVNYHFRDKEGLYRAVLEDIFSKAFQKFPSVPPQGTPADPEKRLFIFIRAMFYRFLSREGWGGLSGHGKLIAREFLNPTPAFDNIVETYIRPQKNILSAIVSDVSGGKLDQDAILSCAVSIIGQCIYYTFAAPIIEKIAENPVPIEKNLDFLSDHVFRFSLGGIQRIVKTLHENNGFARQEVHP